MAKKKDIRELHKKLSFWIVVFVLIVAVPIIIHELFKLVVPWGVLFEAQDVLIFYGSALAGLGAFYLGSITIAQNDRVNEQNERANFQLKTKEKPFFSMYIDTRKESYKGRINEMSSNYTAVMPDTEIAANFRGVGVFATIVVRLTNVGNGIAKNVNFTSAPYSPDGHIYPKIFNSDDSTVATDLYKDINVYLYQMIESLIDEPMAKDENEKRDITNIPRGERFCRYYCLQYKNMEDIEFEQKIEVRITRGNKCWDIEIRKNIEQRMLSAYEAQ